jgi:hypothetical protein
VSPVKYELGFYIPEGAILHSYCRENLKSYNLSEVQILVSLLKCIGLWTVRSRISETLPTFRRMICTLLQVENKPRRKQAEESCTTNDSNCTFVFGSL